MVDGFQFVVALNTPLRNWKQLFKSVLTSFVPYPPFLNPLKTSENLVFRGYRKGALETNGLKVI